MGVEDKLWTVSEGDGLAAYEGQYLSADGVNDWAIMRLTAEDCCLLSLGSVRGIWNVHSRTERKV